MSRSVTDMQGPAPAKSAPAGLLSLKVPTIEVGDVQEDDAPTRMYTKKGTNSASQEEMPALKWTTTKENELEGEVFNEKGRHPPFYIRNFGNKINPGLDDVRHQAGLRTDSTLANESKESTSSELNPAQVSIMNVMHNWTQEVRDDEFVATINILKDGSRPQGGAVWVHVQDPLPSLERLESLFRSHIARRVQPFIAETTISLFNRVRSTRERKLVSGTLGRFLIPSLTRYSAWSSHTGNEDHPCLFLNFPYLFLGKFDRPHDFVHTKCIQKDNDRRDSSPKLNESFVPSSDIGIDVEAQSYIDSSVTTQVMNKNDAHLPVLSQRVNEKRYHPPRTLLQSRYRLESTERRDKHQTIFNLTNQQIRDCISRPSRNTTTQGGFLSWLLPKKSKRERLYIPQLWGISLSGDVMLTCGPISLEDLCGSTLNRRDFDLRDSKLSHSLVRFIVEHDKRDDDVFNYPAESCEWYFGLVNKQRKIESHLGTHRSQETAAGDAIPTEVHYHIEYYNSSDESTQVVDCQNWLQIQSEHAQPNLDLYLRPSTPSDPKTDRSIPWSDRQGSSQRSSSHPRSPADTGTATIPTSPRLLSTPHARPHRGRSVSSSTRSTSPTSISHPVLPENFTPFFEWPFLEEVTRDDIVRRTWTTTDRVCAWLAKVHVAVYKSHGQAMDISLKPMTRAAVSGQKVGPDDTIKATDLSAVKLKFLSSAKSTTIDKTAESTTIIKNPSSSIWTEGQRVFSLTRQFLKLFVPQDYLSPSKEREHASVMIHVYWSLVDKILDGIAAKKLADSDLHTLSKMLCEFVDLAKETHRGVWRMDGDKKDPSKVTIATSAVIYMPLANALEHLCDVFFDVLHYMGRKSISANTSKLLDLGKAINESSTRVREDFELAQRFLIQGGDEDRYHKSLGPVVTPEGITILLLRRLIRGVYRDGTVNIIEVFERVIQRLATKVERSSSRFLLLELSHVAEEIDIVLTNFQDQRDFLETYRHYLNPSAIKNPGVKRKIRFEYEQNGIEKLINEVDERIKDCEELQEHVRRLTQQNLQLVEGAQDDINNKLMLFTLVTIVFLPPSFVTGFFGMNLQGIEDTGYKVGHFWLIAVPLTCGLLLLSVITLYWNKFRDVCSRSAALLFSDSLDDD